MTELTLREFALIHRECPAGIPATIGLVKRRASSLTVGVEADGAPYVVATCPECGYQEAVHD